MTTAVQAGLFGGPPSSDDNDTTTDVTKVLIPRDRLIQHGRRLRDEGRVQAGNAVLTSCVGAGELVPVSRALAERWGLIDS